MGQQGSLSSSTTTGSLRDRPATLAWSAQRAPRHAVLGLPILAPIVPVAGLIELASGIDRFDGQLPTGDDATRQRSLVHDFLKHGPTAHHWHEYVMRGYDGNTREAIFLRGIPDISASLPHA